MISKRKINEIASKGVLIYFFIAIIINVIKFLPEYIEGVNEYNLTNEQIIGTFFLMILMSIVGAIVSNFFIILIYIAIKIANKTARNDNLNKIDLGKYKGYYREIINEYSPAVLSFIDDFELDYKKDVVATILDLKLKNNVELNDNKIKVINADTANLENNEKYILENGIEGLNEFTFANKVSEDAISKGLVMPKKVLKQKNLKRIKKSIILLIASFMAFMILPVTLYVGDFTWQLIPIIIFLLVLCFYPFFSIIYLIAYIIKSAKVNYVRTKKGEEINEMLEGLKNYIKNYSILDEKNANDLVLWEDYLIYSVLFGQNTKIVDDIYNK